MAYAPKRACTTPRCPYTQPCPVHPSRRQWAGRGTAEERGYGPDWQKLRALVLARDGWACQHRGFAEPGWGRRPLALGAICGAVATHVDHVVSKANGGTDDPRNLRAICAQHHVTKTGKEGRRAR